MRPLGTSWQFYWEKEHIFALVSRIHDHKDGRLTAEISLKTDQEGIPPHILHTSLNLLASRGKSSLAKELEERYPLPQKSQWAVLVEQLTTMSLTAHREGEPVKEVWPVPSDDPIPQAPFLVRPLLYEGKPNMLFGEGGTGKSLLALALALICRLPYKDNPLGLEPKKAIPFYLDYEGDEAEFNRRLSLLQRGFEIPPTPIFYRECTLPFIDDIDRIEAIVAENKIDFVIVDSVGVATSSSNLNYSETATAFYAALRRLHCTSLLISHRAKEQESKKTSPYGSVYFFNIARSIYEVFRQQEEGENRIHLALLHKKNNQGPFLPRQGFTLTFTGEKTILSHLEIDNVPEFLEKLSLKTQIVALLKKETTASISEIARAVDKPENTIRAILSRYKNLFVKVDDDWGLKVFP